MSNGTVRIVVSGQNDTGPAVAGAAAEFDKLFAELKRKALAFTADMKLAGKRAGEGFGASLNDGVKAKTRELATEIKVLGTRVGESLGKAIAEGAKGKEDQLSTDVNKRLDLMLAGAERKGAMIGRELGKGLLSEARVKFAELRVIWSDLMDYMKLMAVMFGRRIGEALGLAITRGFKDGTDGIQRHMGEVWAEMAINARLAGHVIGDQLGAGIKKGIGKVGIGAAGASSGSLFGSAFGLAMQHPIVTAVVAFLPIIGAALNSLMLLAVGGLVAGLGAVSAFKQSSAVSGDFSKEIAAKQKDVGSWGNKLQSANARWDKGMAVGMSDKTRRSIRYDIALDTASLHKAQSDLEKLTHAPAQGFALVKQRAKELFLEMGKPFVSPMVSVMNALSDSLSRMKPFMSTMAKEFAPIIAQLGKGLGDMMLKMMPGMLDALKASMPLFRDLAGWLPELGAAMGDFFKTMADHGPAARTFFRDFLTWLSGTIRFLGDVIGFLAEVYIALRRFLVFWVDAWGHAIKFVLDNIGDLVHDLALAFGWMPNNIGTALKKADEKFHDFKTGVETKMSDIHAMLQENMLIDPAPIAASANAAEKAIEDAFKGKHPKAPPVEISTSEAMAAVRALNARILGLGPTTTRSANSAENALRGIAVVSNASANAIEKSMKHAAQMLTGAFKGAVSPVVASANAMQYAMEGIGSAATRSANAAEEAARRITAAGTNSANAIENGMGFKAPPIHRAPPQTRVFKAHGGLGQGGLAHGGIVGAAGGGIRSGRTLVGEYGAEFADLPPGTMVHPAGTTAAMMAGGGGGGRQEVHVTLDVRGGNDDFATFMRKMVKLYGGGNVQAAFGVG